MENTDFQMGMNMKAWQDPHNFAHEYSGWINNQISKAILGCGSNKGTLDIMDENIPKCP